MRLSNPSAVKGPAPYVLALSGGGYLAYKAEYLGLDAPDALKAFIVLPGVALLIASSSMAFPDARRRIGGAMLALGFVALLWLTQEPLPGGWTFYTPLTSVDESALFPCLKGPSPAIAAAATLLPFLGLAVFTRKNALGGVLLGAALWCALCFAPSRWPLATGMPRRYSYYYVNDTRVPPSLWDRSDAALPVLLALAGATLFTRSEKQIGQEGDPSSPHR